MYGINNFILIYMVCQFLIWHDRLDILSVYVLIELRQYYIDVTEKMYKMIDDKICITAPRTDGERITAFGEHLYLWKKIFNEHLDNLILSKLLFHLETFYIGFVGPKNKIAVAKEILKSRDINYISANGIDSGYEQETQNKLYEFSLNNDGYVLYVHNKGFCHSSPYNDKFRHAIEYHNILNWNFTIVKTTKYRCYRYSLVVA